MHTHINLKNFQEQEFFCKCLESHKQKKINNNLLIFAQILRNYLKIPVTVSSAYRCIKHNKSVNGKIDSKHINGNALDLYVEFKNKYATTTCIIVKNFCEIMKNLGLIDFFYIISEKKFKRKEYNIHSIAFHIHSTSQIF